MKKVLMLVMMMVLCITVCGCSNSSSRKSSGSSYSTSYGSSSSYSDSYETCKFKEGGKYVCNSKATSGAFCSYHKSYLDDAYNSLLGD